ncbi:hypothetical protein GCM10009858_20820 [Terrabacter carboxydivorans]|uniref:Uncharacterized protein n=1 Tax=Terrabacter carboxydivorans TaxID=619730 RepID=A0ABN3LIX0_9MICO
MTKLVKLKSKRAVKKPAPSLAGSGMLDIPLGPPVGPVGPVGPPKPPGAPVPPVPAGATGGGGGAPAPPVADEGGMLPGAAGGGGELGPVGPPALLASGVVGSPPAGRLKDGCSGGFGSDMASLSEGDVNESLACSMLGRGRPRGLVSAQSDAVSVQVRGVPGAPTRRVATRLDDSGS